MTGTTADRTNAVTTVSARNPFSGRDFRLLWLGEAVSAVGDQFALIALPWLALVLTGSALALGGAMALMAIPRAVLMTFGGVAVDRFSPRRVMLGSNAVRLVAVAVLGAAVVAGSAELWMLYAFALVFGVADAFFFPAQTAIVPELVTDEQLQRGQIEDEAREQLLDQPGLGEEEDRGQEPEDRVEQEDDERRRVDEERGPDAGDRCLAGGAAEGGDDDARSHRPNEDRDLGRALDDAIG